MLTLASRFLAGKRPAPNFLLIGEVSLRVNSRQLVYQTLDFRSPSRVPRELWELPWAEINYPEALARIKRDFPNDIVRCPEYYRQNLKRSGSRYEPGMYIDDWGCRFTNYQRGIIGEVKVPLITGEGWEVCDKLRIPKELLDLDREAINHFCRNTDRFVLAAAFPRPFERLQFLRGTEQLYVDLALKPAGLFSVLEQIHDFYCRELEAWGETEVDALWFMDDWGSQRNLLINPELWVEVFKPLYRDYIDIAHSCGKKVFMHSDGYIIDILPHLIELGLDAINSQIFCMGVENLSRFRGQITFWGEIDRQQLLVNGSTEEVRQAVRLVKETLWSSGGCIAQCEFGPGANPDNVYQVFKSWAEMG